MGLWIHLQGGGMVPNAIAVALWHAIAALRRAFVAQGITVEPMGGDASQELDKLSSASDLRGCPLASVLARALR
jgi:hypothetical protein